MSRESIGNQAIEKVLYSSSSSEEQRIVWILWLKQSAGFNLGD